MTQETRIALFLMGELVAALRANDPDLFKRWLYGGIQDLGEPAVTELLLDWLDPFLTVEEQDRLQGWGTSFGRVPCSPDKKAGRGQGERKCSALHVWTNFSVSGCLGSSSGNLNERLAWSSSSKLWSRGPLGTDRSGPWRWLLQEKPPPQARSLRMCTWLSLRGQWSLREKREVVDR